MRRIKQNPQSHAPEIPATPKMRDVVTYIETRH